MSTEVSASGSGSGGVVRMSPADASVLVTGYRDVARVVGAAASALEPWVREAAELLVEPVRMRMVELEVLAIELAYDGDDVSWRLSFLEATDGIDHVVTQLRAQQPPVGWAGMPSRRLELEAVAVLLANAQSPAELESLVAWLWDGGAIYSTDPLRTPPVIPEAHRRLFAGAFVLAHEGGWGPGGWGPGGGSVPGWLAAAMVHYGDPSDDALLALASDALDDDRSLRGNTTRPNPFGLDDEGAFAPFVERFEADPDLGRRFLRGLFDEHHRTGDTRLNMHDSHDTTDLLARVISSAGTTGDLEDRTAFVDELVTVINNDDDTSSPVFHATWAVHAELVLEHDIHTTTPTFGIHTFMPDAMRPAWERTWNDTISPAALGYVFDQVEEGKEAAGLVVQVGKGPLWNLWDWASAEEPPPTPGNDAGGTYSTRAKADFGGTRFHFDDATRGRNIITHALHDASPEGDIAQDEFAIIDHGIGPNGRPTYTINLPGVIDLSNPHVGWDDTHRSVRDMDMAALASAPTARVEDNLYAQMVIRALRANDIELGSNLMLVGHSFGADTAADLAANEWFAASYNVTHLVAAAYDSVPQLAHIDRAIDVLVLQNADDAAILLERTQRESSAALASISVDTFAHDVRGFDGGFGADVGHHPRRYVDYLEDADDPTMTAFFERVSQTGYGRAGRSFAVDVTLDQSLVEQ